MKLLLLFMTGIIIGACGLYIYQIVSVKSEPVTSLVEIIKRPLDAYTIENLSKRNYQQSQIMLGEVVDDTPSYISREFSYFVDGKKVTGLAHIPKSNPPANGFPVLVQLRGYVPKEIYESGIGTKPSSQVLAQNGFLTLAPDFLGYGGSDNPSSDIFEERFQTYTAAATLIVSVPSLAIANPHEIGLWGHSNGGQIAITVLEVLGRNIPTVLWAPVSKVFPYSILYYTDEASDSGKFLRKNLAVFEALYDSDLYSLTNYLDAVNAPLQIHQGTADDAVPLAWTDSLVKALKGRGKTVEYFTYPGADHNLRTSGSDSWTLVVKRDIEFYRKNLSQER